MDGRGRAFNNIVIERSCQTVKCKDMYMCDHQSVRHARESDEFLDGDPPRKDCKNEYS